MQKRLMWTFQFYWKSWNVT